MITAWTRGAQGLTSTPVQDRIPPGTIWLDLFQITRDEELFVERTLGVDVPTREELAGIEASGRLYREGNAVYLTATVLVHADSDLPGTTTVTFIYLRDTVVTLRYDDTWPFRTFAQRAPKFEGARHEDVFLGLLEVFIERLADVIERMAAELEAMSNLVFAARGSQGQVDLRNALLRIGRAGNGLGKVRESLVDKNRLLHFAEQTCREWLGDDARGRVRVLVQDIHSLADNATFFANKVQFLLDATLGLISIEQNRVINILSVAAVVFLPPTLIGSLYGMNFKHMPELQWEYGYPLALLAMVLSAVLPVWWFKRKRWL